MSFSSKAFFESSPAIKQLVKDSGDTNLQKAIAAQWELAKALELPLRQGIMSGDILNGIYDVVDFTTSSSTEFPLDIIAPGTEKDYVAFTIPNHGYIPQRNVEGDYVMIPTYGVGNAIDWKLKFARDANWNIVGRCLEVLQAGKVKKLNDDGWNVILAAAADRNLLVFDSDASAGQFTKRLVSLMKVVMRRNGGGNSSSINRRSLTDLFISPEAMEDMRNWNIDQIDEITRREIYTAGDGSATLNRVFNVNLHDLDELGVGQEYQLFYTQFSTSIIFIN